MMNLLQHIKTFEALAPELEAELDQIPAMKMPLKQATDALLVVRDLADRLDGLQKVLNRNYGPLQKIIAKLMTEQEITSIKIDGVTFTAVYIGHYAAPSKAKTPKEFDELCSWLVTNGIKDAVKEETTVKIGGTELGSFCRQRREDGKELPPHVKEFAEIRISVKGRK
jgi:hypothetical protein